jgi:hypothetical protein
MKNDAEIRANLRDESLVACQHQTGVHENSMVRCRGCPPPETQRMRGVCAAHSPHCLGDKKGYKKSQTCYDIFRNDILV